MLFATVGVGMVLLTVGMVLLGQAVTCSPRDDPDETATGVSEVSARRIRCPQGRPSRPRRVALSDVYPPCSERDETLDFRRVIAVPGVHAVRQTT